MKLGILGKGMIVQDLLKTIKDFDFKTISILAKKGAGEAAQEFVDKNSLTSYYDDYDEMLKSDIDLIYVALPNNLHYSYAIKALLKSKHVIVEKPITANFRELARLQAVAVKNRCMLFEAMCIHHLPSYQTLKEKVSELGDLKMAHFNISSYSSRYAAFKSGNILHTFDPHQAGGALMDTNVYNLHCAVGLFGEPQSFSYWPNLTQGIDTSGIFLLDYGNFKVSCSAAKDSTSPCVSSIQGEEACLSFEAPVSFMTSFRKINRNQSVEEFTFDKDKHRLYYEFKEFLRIIENKDYKKAADLLELSAKVMRIMDGARKTNDIVFDNDTVE